MKRVLRWLAGASSFLFAFSCLYPAELPQRCNPIEDSWIQILHLAFLRHLQFGRDIVFTFGPWGFLYAGYRPETHWLSVSIWLGLATIFWLATRQIAKLSFKNELAQWIWVMALSSLAGIAYFITNDVRFVCWPYLLLILHFFYNEPSTARIRDALIVSLGLISLIKFNMLIVGVAVISAMAAETVIKRKRFPWCVPLYGGSVALFWLVAGQKPSSFLPFLANSSQVASGYTEAMMSNGAADIKFACCFTAVAALLMSLTALAAWKRLRFFSVFAIGTMGFLTFIILKYGFVRDEHECEAALEMIAVAVMCLAIIWPVVREQRWSFRVAGFLPILAAFVFAVCSFHRFKEPSVVGEWAKTLSPSRWLGSIEQTYLGSQYQEAWQQQLTGYRYQYSFPKVKGETDYYSERQIEVLAYDVPYHPRPVFQSYCAYTPKLAELNAAHLRSDNAPQFVVFDNFALDKRYRSLEDGLSWPELLTRYDVQKVELSYTLLSKSKTPRKFNLVPLSDTSVKLGEPFSMPAVSNGPVWAEIEINRTLAGSAISSVYKPPMLFFTTSLRNGDQYTNTFMSGLGRAGFLLSPRIDSSVWFAALGCQPWPHGLSGNEVTSFTIYPVADRFPFNCYQDSVRVRLFRLEFPAQPLESVPGLARLAELKDLWQKKVVGNGMLVDSPDEGSILSVPPDSHIQLAPPKECAHLKLGFGVSLFSTDQTMTGVTFRASTLDKNERPTTLWSQHLNPRHGAADDKQEVSLDLGTNEIANVLIETIPDSTNSLRKMAPYWSQIHFE